jgi:hypothetical protein
MDRRERETTRMKDKISRLQTDKMTLESQIHSASQERDQEAKHSAALRQKLAAQTAERERTLKKLIEAEAIVVGVQKKLETVGAERDRKQQFHDVLVSKERDFIQELFEASLVRDRKAREMAAMKKKTVDAKALAMERNLDYLDLCRKYETFLIQMREFSELYEKVKIDRNRHVNTLQTSRQFIIEMKEKIHILESEEEVLRREFADISFRVQHQKNELSQAFKRRDNMRVALKKAEIEYRGLQAKFDFSSGETDRMNHILQNLEH